MDWFHFLMVCILILHDTTGQRNYKNQYFIRFSNEGNSFPEYEDEYDDALDYHSPHLGLTYGRLIGSLMNTFKILFTCRNKCENKY